MNKNILLHNNFIKTCESKKFKKDGNAITELTNHSIETLH